MLNRGKIEENAVLFTVSLRQDNRAIRFTSESDTLSYVMRTYVNDELGLGTAQEAK